MTRPRPQGSDHPLARKPELLALSTSPPVSTPKPLSQPIWSLMAALMKQRGQLPAWEERLGSPLCWASFHQMTSKAGFSSRPSGLQKSSIKELMGLGRGAGPSVLNYPKCTRPRAGWPGGGWALPAWLRWLPSLSCLASCLPATPDSRVPHFTFFCLSHL